jgi:hypothetical protein
MYCDEGAGVSVSESHALARAPARTSDHWEASFRNRNTGTSLFDGCQQIGFGLRDLGCVHSQVTVEVESRLGNVRSQVDDERVRIRAGLRHREIRLE